MARILVTGVTGQIGWYVAEQLSREGHEVFGLERQTTQGRPGVAGLPYQPVSGDLLDEYSLLSLIERIRPEEVYNFAAQSFIPASWHQPILTAQYTGIGVVRLLEALRRVVPGCRFLQAGSSELFAGGDVTPQDERTPIVPRNPYGVAKSFAYHTVRTYRAQYGMHACNAVFYTNESPRRSTAFVFRKITDGVAAIVAGTERHLSLGDLDAWRDWGWAPDYADAAVKIMRHASAEDFVIASGIAHRVGEVVERAFALVGLDSKAHVRVDPSLARGAEPVRLVGDATKARTLLRWQPHLDFEGLVRTLLTHDLRVRGIERDLGAARVVA